MEHATTLDHGEVENNDEDEQADGVSGRSTSTQPGSPAETEDGSRPSSAMSSSHRGKKRKRPNSLFLVQPKGSDFWSMVDSWFTARMQPEQLGTSWTTPGWTKYVHFVITPLFLT